MADPQVDLHLIYMLSNRLERISVDSFWAHRASGVRGALLQHIERQEMNLPSDPEKLRTLLALGYRILEKAARR
jgi:hypothetical protein